MEFRRVDVGFARRLVALWTTTFEQAYAGVHDVENIRAYCAANYTIEAAETSLSDPRIICTVVFRDHAALGFYLVKHHECPVPLGGGASELKQIYIVADEYGSGVGDRLLDDAMRCIRDAGRSWIWLSVSDRNDRAQSFYRKRGFEPIGVGPVFEVGSDRLTSTVMIRKL